MNRTCKIVAYGLLMLLMASGTYAQKKKEQAMVCRTGLTYEISQKINWGKGKPVVIDVTPYSSAERAGLQLNDIIEEIDGIPTTELSKEDIDILLNPDPDVEIRPERGTDGTYAEGMQADAGRDRGHVGDVV